MAIIRLSRIALAATGASLLLAGCRSGVTNPAVPPPGSEMYMRAASTCRRQGFEDHGTKQGERQA
jgi:hypothetical protein